METASWETPTAMAKQTSQAPNLTRGTRTPSQIQIIGVPYIYICFQNGESMRLTAMTESGVILLREAATE